MKDTQTDEKKEKKRGVNPLATAITGAVVGAGAVIATQAALKNKNTRKKLQELMDTTQELVGTTKEKMGKSVATMKPMQEIKKSLPKKSLPKPIKKQNTNDLKKT